MYLVGGFNSKSEKISSNWKMSCEFMMFYQPELVGHIEQ